MNRLPLHLAVLAALVLAPGLARAESSGGCPDRGEHDADHYCADVEGRAEYTDNALLNTEKQTKTADEIYVVNPGFQASTVRRGFDASIRYSLNYYHYGKLTKQDRALHDLSARAALTWWESVDLEAKQELAPSPVSWANPENDPVNSLQSSRSSGHAGLHHEFGPATRAAIGYRAEYGTWIKVNNNDALPPTWLVHGPEITAERDLSPLVTLGVLYGYRLQTFSGVKAPAPQPLDWQGHVAELNVKAAPLEWLALRARGGFKAITFENKDSKTRATGELSAVVGDQTAQADLSASTDVSQDFLGNPATMTRARLGLAYTPTAPWEASLGGSFGQLEYNLGVPATSTTVKTDQGFFEGDAAVAYHLRVATIRLGVLHHQSTTTIDTVAGSAKVAVNRGYLAVGGQF